MHLSTEEIERTRETLERHRRPDGTFNVSQAAKELGIQRSTLQERVVGVMTGRYGAVPDYQPEPQPLSRHSPEGLRVAVRALLRNTPRRLDDLATQLGEPAGAILEAIEALQTEGAKIERGQGATFVINAHAPPAAYITGPAIEIVSRPDNTFVLGAMGDLHAGSKYCRWDVRADLIKRCEARSAQAILDTGNWIDGEASFNRYDLEAVGLSAQCKLLAARHPKTKLPIYAVTGDDHEGWYEGREGIDVGRYCEMIMRDAGHDWTNLGYMESHIRLVNANTGTNAILAVVHPGGGSAYAMSYKPQKLVEALEGGEKPAVLLIGHYHKLEALNVRNTWVGQTGCCQDQSPFMRKKGLEAHVGGLILTLEQDPNTGAIIGFEPAMFRYFNRGYYDASKRWSRHGDVGQPPRER
jgi:hypothetical protein